MAHKGLLTSEFGNELTSQNDSQPDSICLLMEKRPTTCSLIRLWTQLPIYRRHTGQRCVLNSVWETLQVKLHKFFNKNCKEKIRVEPDEYIKILNTYDTISKGKLVNNQLKHWWKFFTRKEKSSWGLGGTFKLVLAFSA